MPSSRRKLAPALSSPPKQHEPSNKPGTNHLKPTGTSHSDGRALCTTRSIMLLLTSVLPTAACAGQCGRCVQQVVDRHRQIMVRVHQPGRRRDDAVPVGVGIVGEGDLVAILEPDEPGHRIGAGTVHADLAVVIDRHEREGRIDLRIHDGDVQLVDRVDRLPIMHGGAAERVDGELEVGGADRLHVDDVAQVIDVRQDEIFLVRRVAP